MVLEAYTGAEPTYASSATFEVTIQQLGVPPIRPHVYESRSPDAELARIHPPNFCVLHGGCFCNRTISWVEFGQDDADCTSVTVRRRDGRIFSPATRVLPMSYGLTMALSDDHHEATVVVCGRRRHFLLQLDDEPGMVSCDPSSSFKNGFYVWVGSRDPPVASLDVSRTLLFPPGVHRFPGDGIVQLGQADTIVLQRGAWVEGRINVSRGVGPVRVLGHGVMDGSRFTYHGSRFADDMRFVEPQYDRPLLWDGPGLVHPQGHAAFAPPGSVMRAFRMIGWLYNEDGLWVGPSCTVEDSFIRTNDDSIRFYAGSLDDFHNLPQPPRGQQAVGGRVRNVVIAQMFNGVPHAEIRGRW